ncbi:MAG: hypothetical protein H6739_07515 [Alphaproteobacteria bacterium]|nr:hypothetical protein [Alphaproteobacteria bacterium]
MPDLLVRVPPESLPEPLAALLDPARPLEEPARFILIRPDDAGVGALWVAVFAGFGLLALVGTAQTAAREGFAPSRDGLIGALGLGCLAVAARNARSVMRARAQEAAIRERRWRQGLYLLQDGALLHEGERVTFIPRKDVSAIRRDQVEHSGSMKAHAWRLEFTDAQGQAQRITLGVRDKQLDAGRVQRWVETGQYGKES